MGSMPRFPDYTLCGRYDGSKPASRWLAQLSYDQKRFKGEPGTPEEFLEAVEILFDGAAATWLDSSFKYRRMVDRRAKATADDVEDFKEALMAAFPTRATVRDHIEGNVQTDIKNFAQANDEPLPTYYNRAAHLLRRAHGRDVPDQREDDAKPLEPIEAIVLSSVVSAFVEGLYDDELRTTVLMRSVITSGGLYRAFEIVEEAETSLASMKKIEKNRAEKREFEQLRALFSQQWGRSPSAVLAEVNAGRVQFPLGPKASDPMSQNLELVQALGIYNQPQRQLALPAPVPKVPEADQIVQQHKPDQNSGPAAQMPSYRGGRGGYGRGGYGTRGGYSGYGGRGTNPPRSISKNQYINGSVKYTRDMGLLCVRCGTLGHMSRECNEEPLESWERAYLRDMVFEEPGTGRGTTSSLAQLGDWGDRSWRYRREDEDNLPFRDIANSEWKDRGRVGPSQGPVYSTQSAPSTSPEDQVPDVTLEQFAGIKLEQGKGRAADGSCVSLGVVGVLPKGYENPQSTLKKGKTVKFADELKGPATSLDAFLNDGPATRKRARGSTEDTLVDDEPVSKAQKKAHKRGQKAVRTLREIVGRKGLGPIDYQKLAAGILVNVPLLDLYQMSPDLTKAFRMLSTRVNKKNSVNAQAAFSGDVDLGVLKGAREHDQRLKEEIAPRLRDDQKAFRIPAVIRTKRNGKPMNVSLPIEVSQADQGSEIIVATIGLLKALGIKAMPLADKGFSGLTMNVADGTSAELTHYAVFYIGVYGIWRKVEAFVRPYNRTNADDVHLLLGMPWLHTVNAKILVRDSVIEIGDPSRNEKVVKIQGPKFVECNRHRLVLHPLPAAKIIEATDEMRKDPSRKFPEYLDSSSDEDSDDSDSSSDMSSEDEGASDQAEN